MRVRHSTCAPQFGYAREMDSRDSRPFAQASPFSLIKHALFCVALCTRHNPLPLHTIAVEAFRQSSSPRPGALSC